MIKRWGLILFLLFPLYSNAQVTNDFGTWWGAEVRKKFLNDFRASLLAEYRLNENSSFTRNFYIAPAIRYQPLKWLYLNLGYRFDNRYEREERYFNFRHRINFDLGFIYEIKRFELEYRTRLQMHWEDYYTSNTSYPVMFNRNRIGVSYKWPQLPFSTSVNGELWLPLEANTDVSRFRLIAAQEYKLNKKHTFQLRFIFQTDLNNTEIVREYILSTRYIFTF